MKLLAYELNLADRDLYLQHIEKAIEKKRLMLLKKQKYLCRVEKQNHFLRGVRQDYMNYHHYIIREKQDQMKALEKLNSYIDNLNKSGQLSSGNIKDAEEEQHRILREIHSVKKSLDKIIRNIKDVNENHQNEI
jgi:methyl-accepting chemotaxis protein